jgi:hypothetical protein
MFKLADILSNLESNSPEETFIKKLAGVDNVSTPAVVPVETTPAVVPVEPVAVELPKTAETDMKKLAEEADGVGRIMAHSFMDELQKLAVGVVGLTPNPDAIPANPAVQVSNQDVHEADVAKVQSIIQALTQGERAHGVQGYIQVNGQPAGPTEPVNQDPAPIAYDAAKAANATVIENLYARYFGKEN